jgi:hypothetical protein
MTTSSEEPQPEPEDFGEKILREVLGESEESIAALGEYKEPPNLPFVPKERLPKPKK